MTKISFILLVFLFVTGCKVEISKPEHYEGWEQLYVERVDWPEGCYLPERPYLFRDSASLKMYKCLNSDIDVDFDNWNVLLYNKSHDQSTGVRLGAFVYINHEVKKVRLEIVDRVVPNRSGLSSNGYTGWAKHWLIVPKIPPDYQIELTSR